MPTPSMAEYLKRGGRVQGGPWNDDRPVTDRATFLPIGQHDDGSLTFAWPGFMKDAWDSAQRTKLQSAHVPVADDQGFYAGDYRASHVDPLNVASLPILGAGAARGAGMLLANDTRASLPALVESAVEKPSSPMRVWHTSGAVFDQFDPAFSGSAESGAGIAAYPGAFSFSPNPKISGPGGAWRKNLGGKSPHVYEVEIAADRNLTPDTFRPLSQQPPGVQDVVKQNPSLQHYFENDFGKYTPPSDIFRLFKTVIDNGGDEVVVSDPSLLRILSRDGERLAANPPEASLPYLFQNQNDGQDNVPQMSSILRKQ